LNPDSFSELTSGIPVFDDQNNQVAVSTEAAKRGITSVVISRICMCAPSMSEDRSIAASGFELDVNRREISPLSSFFFFSSTVAIPLYMNHLEKKGVLKRRPWISAPLQIALCGVILTFATPLCCALFPQKASVEVSKLEPSARVSRHYKP
jgi:hypothetical protein